MKKLEIERKWLLKQKPVFQEHEKWQIAQYYVPSENGIIRYRKSFKHEAGEIWRYEKIIKTQLDYGVNEEEHFEVTESEFNINRTNIYIGKYRYIYNHFGLRFEIDFLTNLRLTLMELELEDINQEIEIPDFLQKAIIIETTGMYQFSNYNLAKDGDI